MAPRVDGLHAQKRDGNDHPSWVSDDDNSMTTTSSPFSRPTDDDDDHTQYGPPSSLNWSPTDGVPPPFASQYLTKSTLVTSTTIKNNAYYTTGVYTATVTASPIPSSEDPSSSVFPNLEGGTAADNERQEHSNQGPMYATAGAVPVIVIAIIGLAVFFCIRKRRKQRQQAATQNRVAAEMKNQRATVHAYRAPAVPISRAPSYTSHVNDLRRPTSLPPVILGPISAGSNGNYMTGIDTSDVMSTRNARTGLGDPFADGSSLNEEPPPPYKPRSLASRNSSQRMPRSSVSVSSQYTHRSDQRQVFQPMQNPFEDPREDDAVSTISGSALDRNSDNMSIVSDFSYRQDLQADRRPT